VGAEEDVAYSTQHLVPCTLLLCQVPCCMLCMGGGRMTALNSSNCYLAGKPAAWKPRINKLLMQTTQRLDLACCCNAALCATRPAAGHHDGHLVRHVVRLYAAVAASPAACICAASLLYPHLAAICTLSSWHVGWLARQTGWLVSAVLRGCCSGAARVLLLRIFYSDICE
jgi:hypothetical protein